jgi:hypothetical protein
LYKYYKYIPDDKIIKNKQVIIKLFTHIKFTKKNIITDSKYLLTFIYKYSKLNDNSTLIGYDSFKTYMYLHSFGYLNSKITLNDTDYDIETGVLKQNRPIVDEYFYPDLSLRDGKFYRTATSTIPLNLPYLSGEGLSGRGSSNPKGVDYTTQDPKFKEGVMPFGELNQTDWPSCRYRPDQSLSSPVFERCA